MMNCFICYSIILSSPKAQIFERKQTQENMNDVQSLFVRCFLNELIFLKVKMIEYRSRI